MSSRSTVSFVGAACFLATAVTAAAGDWQRLGQAYVDLRSNPVVVRVSSDAGALAKLRVQVKENALEIVNVKVFLAGGESFDDALKAYLGPGDQSRVIDIPGGPKVIEKVELTYRGGANAERVPLVRVFGAS
jgi:hypothetical protein